MMFEPEIVRSYVAELVPNSNILTNEDLVRGNYGMSNDERRVIISSLNELIFMPKRVRQLLYSENNREMVSGTKLDFEIRNFLRISSSLVAENIGGDGANEWQNQTYKKIRNVLAAEGPYGVLYGRNSVVELLQIDMKSQFEVKEKLLVPYGNDNLELGIRTLKYGQSCELDELWEVNSGFESLFESILNIQNQITKFSLSENFRTFHLYIWSDQPLVNFQPSLIKEAISECIISSPKSGIHLAKVLLFISTNRFSSNELKSFKEKEMLALKRALPGGRIFLSPGENEEIFLDPVKKLNRPNSVFESKYLTDAVERVNELGISEFRLLDASRAVIESTQDLVRASCFAIKSECWNGTWAKSLEVDGEQVII
jgi:hypothetical protein